MLRKILKEVLKERNKDSYEYGAVMLFFDYPEIEDLHSQIDVSDLYLGTDENRGYGYEHDPHVTLLYGLHEETSSEDVVSKIGDIKFSPCIIHNVSLFKNPEFDVLKFDVRGKNLHEANHKLKKLPHTVTHANYHPHLTIAYLKPGAGDKYVEMFKDESHELIPTTLIFSKPDGRKFKIPIKLDIIKSYDN